MRTILSWESWDREIQDPRDHGSSDEDIITGEEEDLAMLFAH